VRLPAARLTLGLVVFVLVGWVTGALVTSPAGSGGLGVVRDVAGGRSAGLTAVARAVTWDVLAGVLLGTSWAVFVMRETSVK
jgi:hypothetical protein